MKHIRYWAIGMGWIIWAVALAPLALVVMTPWAIGRRAEQRERELLDAIEQKYGPQILAVVLEMAAAQTKSNAAFEHPQGQKQ